MVANVSIATTDRWKDKNTGESKELTEWHNVVFNGKLAEIATQYLRKGSQVYVEGSLRTRKWQDKSGQDRYSTEVRADIMQMLGGGREQQGGAPQRAEAPPATEPARTPQRATANPAPQTSSSPSNHSGFDDMENDVPF